MKARFQAAWDRDWQKRFAVPRGHLLLRVDTRYSKSVAKFLVGVQSRQMKRRALLTDKPRENPTEPETIPLDVSIELHYRTRTLDQNALMWSLYEIISNEQNGDVRVVGEMVTAEDLYEQDMKEIAPTVTVEIEATAVEALRQLAPVKRVDPIEGTGMVVATIVLTSSHWNTLQMAKHIESLFYRVAVFGVSLDSGADVKHYWIKFREYLSDQEIVLYRIDMNEAEYREATPYCEACGEFVGDGTGHLDHIATRGGVQWSEEKRDPRDWFHLCASCHVFGGFDDPLETGDQSKHGGGIESFVRKNKHLRKKAESALRRNLEGRGTRHGEGSSAPAEAVQGSE